MTTRPAILLAIILSLSGCGYVPRARITYHGEYGDYTYSAKSGFSAELHNIARSKLEITREK